MYHNKLSYPVEIFRKKVFGGSKSQIFFIGDQKCGAWRQNGGSLGDVTEAGRRFRGAWREFCKSGGSEVIFAGIMAPLHPLPRSNLNLIKTYFNNTNTIVNSIIHDLITDRCLRD